MGTAPIIVHVNRLRCIALAGIALVIAILIVQSADGQLAGRSFAFRLLSPAVCLGFTAYYLGLTIINPVALRIDSDGISGYYLPSAMWHEITEIKRITGHKNRQFLGFSLEDPKAFRARQKGRHRFGSWVGWRHGLHLVIPEALLEDAMVEDLLSAARTLHNAASTTDK